MRGLTVMAAATKRPTTKLQQYKKHATVVEATKQQTTTEIQSKERGSEQRDKINMKKH